MYNLLEKFADLLNERLPSNINPFAEFLRRRGSLLLKSSGALKTHRKTCITNCSSSKAESCRLSFLRNNVTVFAFCKQEDLERTYHLVVSIH